MPFKLRRESFLRLRGHADFGARCLRRGRLRALRGSGVLLGSRFGASLLHLRLEVLVVGLARLLRLFLLGGDDAFAFGHDGSFLLGGGRDDKAHQVLLTETGFGAHRNDSGLVGFVNERGGEFRIRFHGIYFLL